MYKNPSMPYFEKSPVLVSILVLLDLCIKTPLKSPYLSITSGFNPCFIGSMYKNFVRNYRILRKNIVSILVLLDLCIKTFLLLYNLSVQNGFNPCFIGSMYKNCELISDVNIQDGEFQSLFYWIYV